MSAGDSAVAAAAAAQEAAEAVFRKSTIEIWTLFGVGVAATVARTYTRLRAVGIRGLTADDYLVWVGVFFYAAQSSLGWNVGKAAQGLANNGMTDEERAALSPDDPEYRARVIGSKIQVAGWTVYSVLIWSLKLSMLAFYIRLTEGLSRGYRTKIYIGFVIVLATFVAAIMTIFLACRPFHHYWQINPNPGNACQAAVSFPIIWVSFAANVSTDLYLIMIPLPMLWQSSLKLAKKIASSIVLGAGIFVLVCATLKSIFVIVDKSKGAQAAGAWGIREAFTAVIVTNLPMIFPLLRSAFRPILGSALGSSNRKSYKSPPGCQTIGGGGDCSKDKRKPPSLHPLTTTSTTLVFSESEERITDGFKMQSFSAYASRSPRGPPSEGIIVSNEVDVTSEDRGGYNASYGAQHLPQAW